MSKQQEYVIHNKENESPSYSVIVESSFKVEDNALRVLWVSDSPSHEDLKDFIQERYSDLSHKEIERIYHDDVWHYRKDGVPYGLIVVFFKS